MFIHTLRTQQILPVTRDHAWHFFSNPNNLRLITPPELDFQVLTPNLPDAIYPGMMIEYRVRPLFGIAMNWLTEITHVQTGTYFVDEQRVGPYGIWHHEHHFADRPDGSVEMTDTITYRLAFLPFSELAHGILVAPQLEKIFAFRQRKMTELFPPSDRFTPHA